MSGSCIFFVSINAHSGISCFQPKTTALTPFMELEELNEHLGEARIEEALDLLIHWLDAHGLHEAHDDVVLLKANYKKARYQFEVQGTLPRTDFELAQNRTVSALQAVVRGVKERAGKERAARQHRAAPRSNKPLVWAVSGGIGVLAVAGWLFFGNGELGNSAENDEQKPVVDTPRVTEPIKQSPGEPGQMAGSETKEDERKKKLEADFQAALRSADAAFDREYLAEAQRYYTEAYKLKKDRYVRDRLAVCSSFEQHGGGTYLLQRVGAGEKIPASGMRFLGKKTDKKEDFTNVEHYKRGIIAKTALSPGTVLLWENISPVE